MNMCKNCFTLVALCTRALNWNVHQQIILGKTSTLWNSTLKLNVWVFVCVCVSRSVTHAHCVEWMLARIWIIKSIRMLHTIAPILSSRDWIRMQQHVEFYLFLVSHERHFNIFLLFVHVIKIVCVSLFSTFVSTQNWLSKRCMRWDTVALTCARSFPIGFWILFSLFLFSLSLTRAHNVNKE